MELKRPPQLGLRILRSIGSIAAVSGAVATLFSLFTISSRLTRISRLKTSMTGLDLGAFLATAILGQLDEERCRAEGLLPSILPGEIAQDIIEGILPKLAESEEFARRYQVYFQKSVQALSE